MTVQDNKLKVIAALAVILIGGSLYGYWQKTSAPEYTAYKAVQDTPSTAHSGEVVVYINGMVNNPGVLKVPDGTRILEVVEAAGGLAPGADVAKINLAQQVKDGMHIHVPGSVVAIGTQGLAGGAKSQVGDKVNINTGSKADLDTLPGIGPALAERIIEYRSSNGFFTDIAEVKKVPGISESKFKQLKDKITI